MSENMSQPDNTPSAAELELRADKERLERLEAAQRESLALIAAQLNAVGQDPMQPDKDPIALQKEAFEQGEKKELELFFKDFYSKTEKEKVALFLEKFPEHTSTVTLENIDDVSREVFMLGELNIITTSQPANAETATQAKSNVAKPVTATQPAPVTQAPATPPINTPPTTPVPTSPAPANPPTPDMESNEPLSPEQRLRNRFVGRFIESKDSGLGEIIDITQKEDGSLVVRMQMPGKKGGTELKEFADKEALEDGIVDRGERLQLINTLLQESLKADLDNMGSVKKTWLQIRKAIWSRGFAVGLSDDTQYYIKRINQYLDSLTHTAERRLRERNPDITDEEITEKIVRYKARFASGLQIQTEQAALEKMKDDAINSEENRATRAFHNAKEWWGTVKPWKKRALTYGIMAGTTALSLASGTGIATRLASMAGGMITGMSVRGISDKLWESSEATEELRSEIETRQDTINTLTQEVRKLNDDKRFGASIDDIQEKQNKLHEQIRAIQTELATFKATIEGSIGKINKKRIELENKYNTTNMPLGQYAKEDAALRAAEDRASSIKKLIATAATIGVAIGIGASINALSDSSIESSTPDTSSDNTEAPSTTAKPLKYPVMEPPSPLDPNYVEPEPTPFDPDYKEPIIEDDPGSSGTDRPETDPIIETPDNKVLSTDKAGVGNGEGITHAFKHQLDSDPELLKIYEEKLGMDYESNKGNFLAKLAKEFGYIDEAGNDVRVAAPNVSAYQLNMDGSVSEFNSGEFTEAHSFGDAFEKPVDNYEYSWDGSDQHQGGGGGGGVEMETTPINPDGVQPETTPITTDQPETTPIGVEMETTPINPDGVQLETTSVVKTSPENILSSTETTTAAETAPTILDRIQGVNAAETASKLLGQFFEKNSDGHWVIPGTDIHFDNSVGAEYSHADDPTYDPDRNIANLKPREIFSAMDNGFSAENFAREAGVSVSQAEKVMGYFKQLRLVQNDIGIDLAKGTTFGNLTRNVINSATKA